MRSERTPLQSRRLQVAVLTFMVTLLILLASILHGRTARLPDKTIAMQDVTRMQGSIPLHEPPSVASGGSCDALPDALRRMLFSLDGCTVTGISPDGRIVGFDVDDAPADVRNRVIDGMRECGWVSLDSQGDAVLSFAHEGLWDDDRVRSDGRYAGVGFALVVIQPLGDSTSVLLQLA